MGNDFVLEAAAAMTTVNSTSQAKSQDRKRAAAAQQLHTLLVASAPPLKRREFKRALQRLEPELCRRLTMMHANAAVAKDGASGSGVQHEIRGE